MVYILSLVHISACVFIVLFILLQDPKGGVLGVLGGGGGSKSLFGSGGASSFLITVTKWLAITFVITSVALSYLSANKESDLMLKPVIADSPIQPAPKKPSKEPTSKEPTSKK